MLDAAEKIGMKVTKWFDFEVPSPTVPRDYIEQCIKKYEEKSKAVARLLCGSSDALFWLGSNPVDLGGGTYSWIYLQEEFAGKIDKAAVDLLMKLKPSVVAAERAETLQAIRNSQKIQAALKPLHNKGLVVI